MGATAPDIGRTGLDQGRVDPERLARRARGGSRSAFAALVRHYEDRIFNFHLRRAPCAADAADLTQETFVRAWLRLDRYDVRRRFSTWLFTIAARLAVDHERRRRRRARLHARGGRGPARSPDPGRVALAREEARHVWTVADRVLSGEQRSGLWLRYAEQLSIADVARVLGKTRLATRVMLFRAREKLACEAGGESRAAAPARRRGAGDLEVLAATEGMR